MPTCFVAGCPAKSKKQQKIVTLFNFPRTADLIREWLLACGVTEDDIAARTAEVLADRNGNRFRVCSNHFSSDLFMCTSKQAARGKAGKLVLGAIPNLRLAKPGAYAPIQIPIEAVAEEQPVEVAMEVDIQPVSAVENMVTQTDQSFCSMVTSSVQTECNVDDVGCQTEAHTKDAFVQWPEFELNVGGESSKVRKDHTYTSSRVSDSPPIPLPENMQSTPMKRPLQTLMDEMQASAKTGNLSKDSWDDSFVAVVVPEQSIEPNNVHCIEEPLPAANRNDESTMHDSIQDADDKTKDPDYAETSLPADDSFFEKEDNDLEDMVQEKKYLVFRSCLLYLFSFLTCNFLVKGMKCGKPLINLEIVETASLLEIEAWCFDLHPRFLWKSQPMVKRIGAGNLLLASSLLFSGLTYEKLATFAGFLGLMIVGKTTFYHYQKTFLFPTIHDAWEHEKMLLDKMFSGVSIGISGDGQCDSPGFSAKYLVYTIVEQKTSKIISIQVVQVTECTSSVAMEKHALEMSLEQLLQRGLKIEILTTDRHVSNAKLMRDKYKGIKHQFDVWHMAKSVMKKITEAARKKDCRELAAWSQSLTNHLWWCSRSCGKNLELLKEMWMSVLLHSTGKHQWHGYNLFHKCGHAALTPDAKKAKKWLKPETPAHDALVKIVCDKTFVRDLSGLTEFTHTGKLESFHSAVLRVRQKLIHYSIDGMWGRTELAALTHNANTGRTQKRKQPHDSEDDEQGELMFNIAFPKRKKAWVVKKIFEGMNYSHVYDMQVHVLTMQQFNLESVWESHRDEHPQNIASVEAPPKAELIKNFKSRF